MKMSPHDQPQYPRFLYFIQYVIMQVVKVHSNSKKNVILVYCYVIYDLFLGSLEFKKFHTFRLKKVRVSHTQLLLLFNNKKKIVFFSWYCLLPDAKSLMMWRASSHSSKITWNVRFSSSKSKSQMPKTPIRCHRFWWNW